MEDRKKCSFCEDGIKRKSSEGSPAEGEIYNLLHTPVLAVSCSDGRELRFPKMKYCPVCGRSLTRRQRQKDIRHYDDAAYTINAIYNKDGVERETDVYVLAEDESAALAAYYECVARTPSIRAVGNPAPLEVPSEKVIEDQFRSEDIRELETYGSVAIL